jgi:transglutaminase-like putative cysteine protease
MEKTVKKDEPLKFEIEFSYKSAAEWFNLDSKDIRPYDTNSDLYKTYTSEQPPHILFSDSIEAISERIISNETDPYQKMKKIFTWINESFLWAGAREYSTIDNIPAYVLENGHGDCGQVTLLFITLARYNGCPARWQSGFMMHPGSLNLHDWSEFYIEGIGWIPMDQSFGINRFTDDEKVRYIYSNGIDAYRWIVNNDYSQPLFPEKIYPRSETVDFQRGELEWKGGNLYFDKWNWDFNVTYIND